MKKRTKNILIVTILAAAISSLITTVSVLLVAEKNYMSWLEYLKGGKLTKDEKKYARRTRLKEEVRPSFNRKYIRIDMNKNQV